MDSLLTRRTFFAGAATAASAARVLGANDRIQLGLIGARGRGNHLINMANANGGVDWVAVCDAWDLRRDQTEKHIGASVAKYADYRALLGRKEIDGVIVATFDHLHAPITVAACQAGKDVYVEKPMTSIPTQGRDIVNAVRDAGRVVQVGVQQRSIAHFIEAKQSFFDSGMLGRVNLVRTVWNGNRGYLEAPPAGMQQKPAGLDWDACLGWLPKRPWDPKRYFNRFAYWDFSTGGQTGGLFVHLVDVVHWYLGLKRPESAVALGAIHHFDDGRDTPDTINAVVDYPEHVSVTFEATLNAREMADILFLGTEGRLSIFRGSYKFTRTQGGSLEEVTVPGGPEPVHMGNWLACMRSRNQPNANVVDSHYSAMACHILNIAYQQNTRVQWKSEWDV
jgi:predicted dehydrogenase